MTNKWAFEFLSWKFPCAPDTCPFIWICSFVLRHQLPPSFPCAHCVEINSIEVHTQRCTSGHTIWPYRPDTTYLPWSRTVSSGRESARLSDPGWNSRATGVCGWHEWGETGPSFVHSMLENRQHSYNKHREWLLMYCFVFGHHPPWVDRSVLPL